MPAEDFRAAVAERIALPAWVADGNYQGKLGDLVWRRADTVVWFDLPRWLVMAQIIRRTLIRALTARELWNGNREPVRHLLSLDPERSVIVWAWRTHPKNRLRYTIAQADPAYRHIDFIRLRSHRDTRRFLSGLAPSADMPSRTREP